MTTLEEQIAARREVILRRRALKGEQFAGSKEIRAEHRKKRKEANKKIRKAKLMQDPMYRFKATHWGLRPEQLIIFLEKGGSVEDLPEDTSEKIDKRFLSGPKPGDFKNRIRDLRRKYRREGVPGKSEQSTNMQPRTIQNPLGAGSAPKPLDLEKMNTKSHKILETTQKVANSGIDFVNLPGFYDTKHDPEAKLHAVTSYVVTGSFVEASRFSAVPTETIKTWRKTAQWWPSVVQYVQQARQEELDSHLSGVIHKTVEVINDRLEDGDYKYNAKLDKLVRVPVQAKDAAAIADKAISNRNLLRGDPTSRADSSTLAEKIQDLKQQFKEFTEHKVIDADVERVDD